MQFGFRGDDDLGAVTDRTGRVEGRTVTASSCGVRGHHSTSDISSTSAPIAPAPPIPFRTHPPTTSYHPYTSVPYDPYGYFQPPQISYDPYAHAPSLPIRMPGLDPIQHFSRTQIPLNDVSGPGLQLVSSLCIHSIEVSEDEREDDGRHDDDDNDSDDDGDDHEPLPVVEASSSGRRPATSKGKGLTGSFMSVMSKIVGSRQKRPEKSRPPTNPTQRKKSKNDGWEQTGPSDLDISDSSIGINAQDLAGVANSPRSGLSTEQRAACYVLYLLGSSLFTDKSGKNNVSSISGFAWGAATLAYLYRSLGQVSRADAKELSGCWSLLENPDRLPRGVQLPTIAPITPHVLLDMVDRELDLDDIDDTTKVSRASDMIKSVVVTWLMGNFLCIQSFYICNRKNIKHHKPETH
ncbi:hypothetical protein M9H77_30050 [Catharanthus roseus]|uniref:Uncharacterized protein n=1 Tax=Catharanthus roseus TaxID=4058 RepID=A0ACB9ZYD6_CATRO|nr:hypothetical protein M9H77_30050 [Catharanthus roseus]